jgi:hypothetical protein
MDAFRGLAAKAKDIFIQCSEKVSTNTLMNWEAFKMQSDQQLFQKELCLWIQNYETIDFTKKITRSWKTFCTFYWRLQNFGIKYLTWRFQRDSKDIHF